MNLKKYMFVSLWEYLPKFIYDFNFNRVNVKSIVLHCVFHFSKNILNKSTPRRLGKDKTEFQIIISLELFLF